jgi:predicted lipoprotein with Yx(FWY)xxD motif
MYKAGAAVCVPIALILALAGCGSSKSRSSAASAPPKTSSAAASTPSAAPTAPYGQASTGGAQGETALITTKQAGKLGKILAFGSKKLTVYLFESDKPASSSCTSACASVWPPVTGSPKAVGGAMSGELGTITRPDGTKQVTYKGHPLYLYVKDKDDGDTYGEGIKSFGAGWYVLAPSGNKVDLS